MGIDRAWPALAIFALTLVLVLVRPRGLPEAVATVLGAALMLATGCVSTRQAIVTVQSGLDVLLFLFALMLYAALLERSGFFAWAAAWSVRLAHGDTGLLYRNVFLVGAVTTALLSLDTTAVVLTPAVIAFVDRLKLKEAPFLLACAFISNTGSLFLPISNLTNLIFQSQFHLTFARFAEVMAFPQLVAVALNYFLFRYLFRADLSDRFTEPAGEPREQIGDRPFFAASLGTLGFILIGYFVGSSLGIPPYGVAICACAILGAVGFVRKRLERGIAREISWSLFPFVVGLFVVVRAVENLPLVEAASRALAAQRGALSGSIFGTSLATALGSNVVNNIPAALVSANALKSAGAPEGSTYAALVGCNIGPNLTVFGSLATMLVISGARKRGIDVSASTFFRVGLIAMPVILIGTTLALVFVAWALHMGM
jgi:arsenical pump membrane protein